jgi:hypothetical protein
VRAGLIFSPEGPRPVRRSPVGERQGFLASAIRSAEAWLLEPAEPAPEEIAPDSAPRRPVVAVFGLARGCGTTVVARALAAELAARDPSGTAAVACDATTAGIPLATRAASQLARALQLGPGVATRAVGRLCLVEGPDQLALADSSRLLAPFVLDAGSTSLGGVPAALADRTILVSTPALEPALARVAAGCLVRGGVEPLVVLNRVRSVHSAEPPEPLAEGEGEPSGMSEPPATAPSLTLPDARMGAQLAMGGREPRGELGRAIARLADWCEDAVGEGP